MAVQNTTTHPRKIVLGEDRLPKSWYNIAADLPAMPPPPLHPGTLKPVGPDDLSPLSLAPAMQSARGYSCSHRTPSHQVDR